jgi:CheY-like chemotaxis protein
MARGLLELPQASAAKAPRTKEMAVIEDTANAGLTDVDVEENLHGSVILGEDDRAMRDLLARALRKDGYRVLEAGSGVDVLDCVEQVLGDRETLDPRTVIVSDIRMRRLSGLQVLATLRGLGWRNPVILITAFSDEETQAEARSLGATALIDKPFDVGVLLSEIERILPAS